MTDEFLTPRLRDVIRATGEVLTLYLGNGGYNREAGLHLFMSTPETADEQFLMLIGLLDAAVDLSVRVTSAGRGTGPLEPYPDRAAMDAAVACMLAWADGDVDRLRGVLEGPGTVSRGQIGAALLAMIATIADDAALDEAEVNEFVQAQGLALARRAESLPEL